MPERAPERVLAPQPVRVQIVYDYGSGPVDRDVDYLGYRREGKQMRELIVRGIESKRSYSVRVDAIMSITKGRNRHTPISSRYQLHNLAIEFHAFIVGEPIPDGIYKSSTRR